MGGSAARPLEEVRFSSASCTDLWKGSCIALQLRSLPACERLGIPLGYVWHCRQERPCRPLSMRLHEYEC